MIVDGATARATIADARLMLLFSPELCAGDPLDVLSRALDSIDVVQVRIKSEGRTAARELADWTLAVLERVDAAPHAVAVVVNDRVDVAAAYAGRGVAGVHVGADDMPPALVRELLGPNALIGYSTHSPADVAAAGELEVDYLGFGPVHPTSTKGYERGLGPEAAWVAASGAAQPVFPIGGIDATNADELSNVGRAAVSSAILGAPDPGEAAATIRALLLDS